MGICPRCNGAGKIGSSIYDCSGCEGTGESDSENAGTTYTRQRVGRDGYLITETWVHWPEARELEDGFLHFGRERKYIPIENSDN